MATRSERPRFFEGQYIGSADLEAVIAYARNIAREHALGAHSWGVATGLDLVESPAEGGGVDYFVLPGFGWDGYGRPLVLLEPRQVPASKFASLPTGNHTVWLRYNEAPFQGLRAGFEGCGSEDVYSRIRESVEVEVGAFGLSQRESGIEIGGIASPDARLAPRLFQDAEPTDAANTAPVLCDGDVPHQAFPADTSRWLVPLGSASWDETSKTLKARSADELKTSRTLRRMAGTVAENLFAADGLIRLRDRYQAYDSNKTLDELCSPLTKGDLENAVDALGNPAPRLVGTELVWVEGNLRVTGQARLFGTRLELRDSSGDETNDTPIYARRAVSPDNLQAGQDFQVVIGKASDGANRFVVGPSPAGYGDTEERFLVRDNGVFAAGSPIPQDLKTNSATIAASAGATLGLAADAGKIGTLAFQSLSALTELAHVAYDDGAARKLLHAGVGSDPGRFTYWTAGGRFGIGTATPQARLDVAELGGTRSLWIEADSVRALDAGTAARLELQSGGGGAYFNSDLAQSTHVAITGTGRLGLGTDSPSTALHVVQAVPTVRIASNGGGNARIELASGGETSLTHEAATGRASLVNAGVTSMTWSQDKVGIGLGTGAPITALHVRGNVAGNAAADSNHVALIENAAGSGADVLALRVSGAANQDNNFITFFDNTGVIGRIEQSTTVAGLNPASASGSPFLRLLSGGADFAECLPRRDPASPIGAGRIVGVRAGRVSLDTAGADSLMVTTDRAVVVGNAMKDSETSEMVAFIGQVFVEVDGPVASGDFILPSGRADGAGRAVPPGRLSPGEAPEVVGRAWSDSPGAGPGRVCVAVGVQGADAVSALSAALANQQRMIEALHELLGPTGKGG